MGNESYNNQIRQLRILAEAALTHYDIGGARLSLLSHRENTLFRINATPRLGWTTDRGPYKGDDSRFVLRLCNPHGPSFEQLRSELFWLSVLRQETDLVVPEPVPARNGEFVIPVEVEDMGPARYCVLLRWVEGRFVDSGLTPALFERVGSFMARLHRHARYFVPPDGFERPTWELAWIFGRSTVLNPDFVVERCNGLIGEREQRLFAATAERTREEMRRIRQDADHYGLIHNDLQQTNYLFHKGEVRAIDFNDCCWGYYLFDIAITLSGVAGRPDEEEMRKAFFNGYARVRPLPQHFEKQLQTFTALRIMKRLNYLFRSENSYIHAEARPYLDYALDQLGKYVGTKTRKTYAMN